MEPVSFIQIGIFIACLLILLGGAVGFKMLQRNPPLHREFVDRETYDKDQRTIAEQHRQQAVSRKAIYLELESQGKQIAALQAETSHQTRALHALDTKIDNLPERMIRLIDRKAAQ